MSTIKDMERYRKALGQWKKRGGLKGGGGTWDSASRSYRPMTEPQPGEFNLDTDYLRTIAKQIRKQVIP